MLASLPVQQWILLRARKVIWCQSHVCLLEVYSRDGREIIGRKCWKRKLVNFQRLRCLLSEPRAAWGIRWDLSRGLEGRLVWLREVSVKVWSWGKWGSEETEDSLSSTEAAPWN